VEVILAAVVPHLLPKLVHGPCGVEELNGEEVDLGEEGNMKFEKQRGMVTLPLEAWRSL